MACSSKKTPLYKVHISALQNSSFAACLTAVMHDPKNFDEPDRFIPDRFFKNGQFVNDIRVVTFSIGLRNCIGKQIAIDEYFVFATNIIRDFRLSRYQPFLVVFLIDIFPGILRVWILHLIFSFECRKKVLCDSRNDDNSYRLDHAVKLSINYESIFLLFHF